MTQKSAFFNYVIFPSDIVCVSGTFWLQPRFPFSRHNPKQQVDRHLPPASQFHPDWEKTDLEGTNISGYERYSLHAPPNLFIINFTTLKYFEEVGLKKNGFM